MNCFGATKDVVATFDDTDRHSSTDSCGSDDGEFEEEESDSESSEESDLIRKCRDLYTSRTSTRNNLSQIRTDAPEMSVETGTSHNVRSKLDLAMERLRSECMSLMDEDNIILKKLLDLNKAIGEVKKHNKMVGRALRQYVTNPSLDNDDNPFIASPSSTWSSSSSSHTSYAPRSLNKIRNRQKTHSASSRNNSKNHRLLPSMSVVPTADFVQNTMNDSSKRWSHDGNEERITSYDSGIQEPSSDSEHEIFV